MKTAQKEELFDVLAINIDTSKVRVIDTNKTAENADAIVKMAVMRRGVETEFFADTKAGLYQDGDTWMHPKLPR